jgi:UDPglucose 6-dehydrogenase
MKIVVLGLWHLGCVTAACCAKFVDVVGLDFDQQTVDKLRSGKPPVFEPGLEALITEGLASGRLTFEWEPAKALRGNGPGRSDAEILWVTYDTPVDDLDRADLTSVLNGIESCLPYLGQNAVILLSSQIPAGTCRHLDSRFPGNRFAYSPENLRLGKAIEIFLNPDRIILGTRTNEDAALLMNLLRRFSNNIILVSPESAELIKHGVNSFLAVSIAFMNEIARICERIGANAHEVELGLKSESRIGPKAYLSPGGPFAGGTLARDVVALTRVASSVDEELFLIPAAKTSNDRHKEWAISRLREELGELKGKRIAILGLTYKPNTDTLRRSLAIELARVLINEGSRVTAFDPLVTTMPSDLTQVSLTKNLGDALSQADAAVVGTEWPELLNLDWKNHLQLMRRPIVLDANEFLSLPAVPGLIHRSVGKPRNP